MSKYNEKDIITEYLLGISAKEIALKLGTYNTTIRRILLRNNIKLRNQSEAQRRVSNPFVNLNDRNVQYWLGMLAADGTIGNKEYLVSLGLQEKDLDHVLKYSSFVDVKCHKIISKKFKTIEYRVTFKSKECNLYLRNLGITPLKSKTLSIKMKMTPDFIRGVIDGDGYIRKNTGGIEIATQSENFKEQLISWFKCNNIHCTSSFNGSVFIVGVYSKKDILKSYNLIYKDAPIRLERKYNRLYASLFRNK